DPNDRGSRRAKGGTMNIRTIIAGTICTVALTASVVTLAASPAFAVLCGNGQGQALLLGCDQNTATDSTQIIATNANVYAGLYVRGDEVGISGLGDIGVVGAGDLYAVQGES